MAFTTPDGSFSAYVARPAAAQAPAVVVIQEIFGVNATMREVCDHLARLGYLAVCPDLFWRLEPGVDITDQSQAEWDKALDLMGRFDVDQGVEDIRGVIDGLRAYSACDGKVGCVGYCLGGRLAYLTATRTECDASVGYYGVGIETYLAEAERLHHPVDAAHRRGRRLRASGSPGADHRRAEGPPLRHPAQLSGPRSRLRPARRRQLRRRRRGPGQRTHRGVLQDITSA